MLRLGVVLLGARITIDQIVELGPAPILIVVGAIILTILFGRVAAATLELDRAVGLLTGGAFQAAGQNIALTFENAGRACPVTLAVRTVDIEIRGAGSDGIEAKVHEVEPLGAFTIVDIVIGEKILKVQVAGQPEFKLGSPVRLALTPANCHLFDGESGDVIVNASFPPELLSHKHFKLKHKNKGTVSLILGLMS